MPGMHDLVARESALVAGFVATLREEQDALTHGDTDALPALAARKATLAEQLNSVDGERNRLLNGAGHGSGRTGMAAWLATQSTGKELGTAWDNLLALAREARILNDLNGKLIAMRLQATGEAIAALTQHAQNSALYGPDGQAAPSSGSRIIDSA